MTTRLHPGVYVYEGASGPPVIEGSPTSTTIFVGDTERGPVGPTKIKGAREFERLFGGYRLPTHTAAATPKASLMRYATDGFFGNGGTTAYVLRTISNGPVPTPPADAPAPAIATGADLTATSPGVWGNGLKATWFRCPGDAARRNLALFYTAPGAANPALVEVWERLSFDVADENYVVEALLRSDYVRWAANTVTAPSLQWPSANANPAVAPDARPLERELLPTATAFTGGIGGHESLPAADYPRILRDALLDIDDASLIVAGCSALIDSGTTPDQYVAYTNHFVDYVALRPRLDLFFVGDLARQKDQTATAATSAAVSQSRQTNSFSATYWPHVVIGDPAGAGRNPQITVPPAGYIAGVMARTDARVGVWRAPAGTDAAVMGCTGIEHQLNDLHSDELNPKGINALRTIPGAGRVVWGARTVVPNTEWRYVPVRRTAIFLRTSIYQSIQWAVFAPNDEPLWQSLRTAITAFMETQFRQGAFAGSTSADAYEVKVDSDTTTPDDQVAGVVNIEVKFAPLRPAEFVTLTLSQKTTPNG